MIAHLYNVKVRNKENLPTKGGYIICANHVSSFDYLFITSCFKKSRFMTFCCMAKIELFKKDPLHSMATRIAGMIPVDREGNASLCIKATKEKLMENWGVLIHPEGTRSRTGEMGTFKPGAALLALESHVPIVPTYIKGGYEVFPADKAFPRIINWSTRSKYKIEVIYGEPIFPENDTVDTLMKRLYEAVQLIAQGDAHHAIG
jgi:long-chain acyl-CoA synthetase